VKLTREQAKALCLRYMECSWDIWKEVCEANNADPSLDALHEAYEHIVLRRLSGVETLTQLTQFPLHEAELLNAASHAMACLLVANQIGSPECTAGKKQIPKCRYCAITPFGRHHSLFARATTAEC